MDIGIAIFFTDSSISPADLARACEERGFESLWVAEHSHIPVSRDSPFPGGGDLPKQYYDVMDPFVTLAAAASVTTTLGLGTGICLVPQRDPIQTAKAVASLDQVSGGRFLFGVGGGWNREEMANHGTTDFAGRWKVMRERIEAMKAIWTEKKAEYHGDTVDFAPIYAWPKPVQKPHPPIHVAGAYPHGAKRAVKYGDGWVPINPGKAVLADQIAGFRAMCAEAGRPALPVSVFGGTPKLGALEGNRELGVVRTVLFVPAAGRDQVLPLLDGYAELKRQLG